MKIELTFDELRAARPELPIKIVQRLGHDPQTNRALACDGVAGPATRRAIYLNPDAVTTPVARVALKELLRGAGEVLGKNDGPDVWLYNRARGVFVGPYVLWAWCALFASWCLWQVYAAFPKVSGAVRLVRDHLTQVQPHELRADDLLAWWSATRGRPFGHVGIVAAITKSRDAAWTIEGNVDLIARLDGVAARRLPLPHLTRADGSPLACCGRYTKGDPKPALATRLDEDGDGSDECDDHCV